MMERDLEDIITEAKEYQRLSRQHKQSKFPDAGEPAYLVCSKWLKAYKKYICYQAVKQNLKPTYESNHCEMLYPGEVSNQNLLL